jgi:hypothetical protein
MSFKNIDNILLNFNRTFTNTPYGRNLARQINPAVLRKLETWAAGEWYENRILAGVLS